MNYLIMFIGGLFGIIIHSLIKINGINKRMPNQTFKSVLTAYFEYDFISLITSFVVVLAAIFISSEFINFNDAEPSHTPANLNALVEYKVAEFIKTTFVVVGYCADSLVYAFLGTVEKKLEKKATDGGVDITPEKP